MVRVPAMAHQALPYSQLAGPARASKETGLQPDASSGAFCSQGSHLVASLPNCS